MLDIEEFIPEQMDKIFKDFKKNKKNWCKIKELNLNADSYKDECYQQYYLLRYFPAYLAEYFQAFKHIPSLKKRSKLKVLSIGCGAGIDYWAMQYYIDRKDYSINLEYTGVDLVKWKYRPSFKLINDDIINVDASIFKDVDLIIFPKSLPELSNEALIFIADKIIEVNLTNILFLNSYITDDSNSGKINGISKFNILSNYLIANGYETENDLTKYWHYEGVDGIRAFVNFFIYPNHIKEYLNHIKKNCEIKDECIDCKIDMSPILKAKYMTYNVFEFSK